MLRKGKAWVTLILVVLLALVAFGGAWLISPGAARGQPAPGTQPDVCADVNDSGGVDLDDAIEVLGSFGGVAANPEGPPPYSEPHDLDVSGTVDLDDALLTLSQFGRQCTSAPAQEPTDEMRVDADPGTGGVQTTRTVAPGATFDVDVHVTNEIHAGYQGYQVKLAFEETIVNATAAAPIPASGFCPGGAICIPAGPTISNAADALGQGSVFGGEGIAIGPLSTFEGAVYRVTLQCIGSGTSPLDLRPPPADPVGQNTTLSPSGSHPTTTFDAEVTCETPLVTFTPTATVTVTPTPTRTPTATATPTSTATPVTACLFVDDSDPAKSFTVNVDGTWLFSSPVLNVSGSGAQINGDQVALMARVGTVAVWGSGHCPSGPGAARAIDLVLPTRAASVNDSGNEPE
jgi:hypothetical protein